MTKNNQQGLSGNELDELLDLINEDAETLPPSQILPVQIDEDDWLGGDDLLEAPAVAQAPTVQPAAVTQAPAVAQAPTVQPAAVTQAPVVQPPVVAQAPAVTQAPVVAQAPAAQSDAPAVAQAPAVQRPVVAQAPVVWGVSPKTLITIVVSVLGFALVVIAIGAYMWNEGEERRERMHNADRQSAEEQQKVFLDALMKIGNKN